MVQSIHSINQQNKKAIINEIEKPSVIKFYTFN